MAHYFRTKLDFEHFKFNQKLIRIETCNERSQLPNIQCEVPYLETLAPVFYESKHSAVNKCCKIIEICKYASLGFFSECFTELFHSIFGQLFWTFVFSFSSHGGVLYYIISRENIGGIASRCSCELIG